ncbi:carbohydrate ABC transporter permease [Actinotalea sp. C106]|uniref:carbohydrate ABC transporter permease n=1 Tax=Actinotalea sp. C106 TaxID=2908644 RepID=UPI00202884A7|nr:sugar ABC transporter permease [Actinotalea sp. C106]
MATDLAVRGPVRRGQTWQHRLMVSPLILTVLVLGAYPLVFIVGASLTESTLGNPFQEWAGLASAREVVASSDVTDALARGAGYAVGVAALSTVLGVVLALALLGLRRGGGLARGLLLLPLMTPPVVVAIVWRLVFNPAGGLLATLLGAVGYEGQAVAVLSSPGLALLGVAIADTWQWTPLVMLLVYAGLLGLDREVLEAAALDGAHGLRLVRHVVLPSVAGVVLAAFFVRLVLAFKVYDLVAVMTAGGPGQSTTVPSYLIHQAALQQFDLDRAAVITLLLAVVVTVVTVPVALLTRKVER